MKFGTKISRRQRAKVGEARKAQYTYKGEPCNFEQFSFFLHEKQYTEGSVPPPKTCV